MTTRSIPFCWSRWWTNCSVIRRHWCHVTLRIYGLGSRPKKPGSRPSSSNDSGRSAKGRRLTIEGRYPSYTVAEFIPIEVRPAGSECLIDDKRVPSLMFESSVAKLEEALAALSEKETVPEVLLEQLFSACRRAVAVDSTLALDGIPIRLVFRELLFVRQEPAFFKNPTRTNYREYNLRAFSRDLSRLMTSGRMETQNGHRLNLGPTSTADGVAIRHEGAARNIGRVGFTKGDR